MKLFEWSMLDHMRTLSIVVVTLFLVLLNACSNNVSPNGDIGPGTKPEFMIISVDQDSVYWGDKVSVTIVGAPNDSIRLFLHSVVTPIDSVWVVNGDTSVLRFTVSVKSGSGQLRLFKDDTIQARGSFSLVVLPRLRSSFISDVNSFLPSQAYVGDLVVITGTDIPMRWRDIAVTVNNIPLSVESWDSAHIFVRVTSEVQTGIMRVLLFDKTKILSTFRKLDHEGLLLPDGRISRITVLTHDLIGTTVRSTLTQTDTFRQELFEIPDLNTSTTSLTVQQTPHTDSLLFVGSQTTASITKTIEVRLMPEPDSRVSGIIRFSYIDHATNDKAWQKVSLTVKSMRWMNTQGSYILYAHAHEITDQLTEFFYADADGFSKSFVETKNYDGGGPSSWVNIVFSP